MIYTYAELYELRTGVLVRDADGRVWRREQRDGLRVIQNIASAERDSVTLFDGDAPAPFAPYAIMPYTIEPVTTDLEPTPARTPLPGELWEPANGRGGVGVSFGVVRVDALYADSQGTLCVALSAVMRVPYMHSAMTLETFLSAYARED